MTHTIVPRAPPPRRGAGAGACCDSRVPHAAGMERRPRPAGVRARIGLGGRVDPGRHVRQGGVAHRLEGRAHGEDARPRGARTARAPRELGGVA